MAKINKSQQNKIRNRVSRRRVTRPFREPDFPDMIVMEYGKAINREVGKIDDLIKEILVPELDRITSTKDERLDLSKEDFKKLAGVALVAFLISKIKSKFYGETLDVDQEPSQTLFSRSIKRLSEPFLKRADEFQKDRFVAEFERQTGTRPLEKQLDTKQFIEDATRKNISLIKTVPQQYLGQVQTIVENAVSRGQLTSEVVKELVKVKDNAKSRARLIARDQVGKLVAVTNEARQRKLGVTHYIWRTMQDGRVRSFSNTSGASDHKRLEGKLIPWGDPPVTVFKGKRAGERHHAGTDINCFIAGTMIKTENGEKPIEQIKIGDVVHSHWGLQKVVEYHKNHYDGGLIGVKLLHKTIWVTPGHKIHTINRGWVEACHLNTSDKVEKLQKFFTCNFFHKEAARNIKHPHPDLICQKQMSIGVDFTHGSLNLNNCVKFVKHKIGLIVDSVLPVWFFKNPLLSVLNAKNVEPCSANNFRLGDYSVIPIPATRARGRWETGVFPSRIFNPLSGYRFASIPDFNTKVSKNFFYHTAIHSGDFVDVPIRPKFVDVLVDKPILNRGVEQVVNSCHPVKEKSVVRTFFRTVNPSFIFELAFYCFKLFTACLTINVERSSHSVYSKFKDYVNKEHLHYAVVGLDCQYYNGIVYNFGVDKSMSYFADGVLVENCRCHSQAVYDDLTGIEHPDTAESKKKSA